MNNTRTHMDLANHVVRTEAGNVVFALPNGGIIPLHALVQGLPFEEQQQYAQFYGDPFPDGAVLFDHCNRFGFEGVVSKRLSSRCMSGPSRNWTKAKCANWKRINVDRGKLLENGRKPEPSARDRDLKKKRAELACVVEPL